MHEIADIACNFTSDRFDNDLEEVIDRAVANNITKFGLICSRLGDIDKFLKKSKPVSPIACGLFLFIISLSFSKYFSLISFA